MDIEVNTKATAYGLPNNPDDVLLRMFVDAHRFSPGIAATIALRTRNRYGLVPCDEGRSDIGMASK